MTTPTNILDAYKRAFKGDPGPPEREDQPPPYRQATAAPEPVADDGYHVADEDDSTADEPTEIYTDVAALLDGELPEPPKPLLLTRTDGHALFYAARVNLLFGDPETGKTWVALAACAEALRDGRRALYVDLDHNGAAAIIRNLLLLGAPKSALRDPDVFRHCECCPALKMTMTPSLSMKTKMVALVATLTGSSPRRRHRRHGGGRSGVW